jgi:hypothetical protein
VECVRLALAPRHSDGNHGSRRAATLKRKILMTTPFLRRSVTALCGFVALHLLACAWAVAPIITYVELFRIHERGRGQQGESYSVEIQAFAPSGKTITVTTPLGGTHTLIEEDDDGREGGEVEYEYNLRNLPNLNDKR